MHDATAAVLKRPLDQLSCGAAARVTPEPEPAATHRVGWEFISVYTLAFGNPFLGRISDRTMSRLGLRRP